MPAVLALLSSLLWGTADYLGGRLSRRLSVLVVVGGSQTAGLVLMVLAATLTGAWGAPTGYAGWAVLASVAGAAGLGLYYRALAIGTMGVVSPIASLGVLVPLAVGVADGERPSAVQVAGIGVALVGVLLASGPEVRGEAGWRPVVLAVAAAVLLGVSLVAIARGSEFSVVMTMTTMRAVTVSLMLLLVLALRMRPTVSRTDVPGLAAVGVLDVGANLTFGVASALGLLSLVSVLSSLYPVAAASGASRGSSRSRCSTMRARSAARGGGGRCFR